MKKYSLKSGGYIEVNSEYAEILDLAIDVRTKQYVDLEHNKEVQDYFKKKGGFSLDFKDIEEKLGKDVCETMQHFLKLLSKAVNTIIEFPDTKGNLHLLNIRDCNYKEFEEGDKEVERRIEENAPKITLEESMLNNYNKLNING